MPIKFNFGKYKTSFTWRLSPSQQQEPQCLFSRSRVQGLLAPGLLTKLRAKSWSRGWELQCGRALLLPLTFFLTVGTWAQRPLYILALRHFALSSLCPPEGRQILQFPCLCDLSSWEKGESLRSWELGGKEEWQRWVLPFSEWWPGPLTEEGSIPPTQAVSNCTLMPLWGSRQS